MSLKATDPRSRITDLDALRGFALFGILVVNLLYFAHPFLKFELEPEVFTGADQWALNGIRFLFEGKFISLFSLLFGLGFTMLAYRFLERELPFYRVYYRRVVMLLFFGAAHFTLLWAGDILFIYGLCALFLPLFLHRKEKTLKIWIVVFLLLPILLFSALAGLMYLGAQNPEVAAELEKARQQVYEESAEELHYFLNSYNSASFGDIFEARMYEVGWMFKGMLFAPGGFNYIMALFLAGILLGKHNTAGRIEELLPSWNQTLKWMLTLGLLLAIIYTYVYQQTDLLWIDGWMVLLLLLFTLGTPLLALSYAILFVNGYRRMDTTAIAAGFKNVGRTALTNYLLQSVIATTLFYGYGLGWYGDVGPAALAGLAVLIFAAQMILSSWYLNHFRMGPAEWLWRVVTYWQKPVNDTGRDK